MSSREIEVWADERWYDALERHLKGETLESKMEGYIDELCRNLLPDYEYEQISKEICQEQQEREAQREANRRFTAFYTIERGVLSCFLVDELIDFMDAARAMRRYTREQAPSVNFRQHIANHFGAARDISPGEFEQQISELIENTGRVISAFDIDLDAGTFGALDVMDGWQYFSVKNICTAAYHADLRRDESPDERWEHFTDYLDGKELTPHAQTQDAPGMGMEPTMG